MEINSNLFSRWLQDYLISFKNGVFFRGDMHEFSGGNVAGKNRGG